MDNIYFPPTQDITYRTLGFPFPFVPHGRFGLPLPRRTPHGVTVVIGKPLIVAKSEGEPSDEAVEALHRRYFEQLKVQFDRHKAAAGYPEQELVWEDKPDKLSQQHERGGRSRSSGKKSS